MEKHFCGLCCGDQASALGISVGLDAVKGTGVEGG